MIIMMSITTLITYIYIYIHMKDDPEYSVDKDAAPTLSYEGTRTDGGVSGGAAYGGRKV